MIKKAILVGVVFSILAVGTLVMNPSVFAAKDDNPANGGIPNGKPFQNLLGLIETLEEDVQADIAAAQAAIEAEIADLQSQIDDLSTDAGNNADAIALLEAEIALKQDLITGSCPTGWSIRDITPSGAVICEFDNGTVLQQLRVFQTSSIGPNRIGTVTVSCPSGWTIAGGGFSITTDPDFHVRSNFQNGNGWLISAFNDDNFRTYSYTVVATCHRVI